MTLHLIKTFIALFFAERPSSVCATEVNQVNQSVISFVDGKIDENTFRKVLKNNSIDPEIYYVIFLILTFLGIRFIKDNFD